jgi:hypothetical protein
MNKGNPGKPPGGVGGGFRNHHAPRYGSDEEGEIGEEEGEILPPPTVPPAARTNSGGLQVPRRSSWSGRPVHSGGGGGGPPRPTPHAVAARGSSVSGAGVGGGYRSLGQGEAPGTGAGTSMDPRPRITDPRLQFRGMHIPSESSSSSSSSLLHKRKEPPPFHKTNSFSSTNASAITTASASIPSSSSFLDRRGSIDLHTGDRDHRIEDRTKPVALPYTKSPTPTTMIKPRVQLNLPPSLAVPPLQPQRSMGSYSSLAAGEAEAVVVPTAAVSAPTSHEDTRPPLLETEVRIAATATITNVTTTRPVRPEHFRQVVNPSDPRSPGQPQRGRPLLVFGGGPATPALGERTLQRANSTSSATNNPRLGVLASPLSPSAPQIPLQRHHRKDPRFAKHTAAQLDLDEPAVAILRRASSSDVADFIKEDARNRGPLWSTNNPHVQAANTLPPRTNSHTSFESADPLQRRRMSYPASPNDNSISSHPSGSVFRSTPQQHPPRIRASFSGAMPPVPFQASPTKQLERQPSASHDNNNSNNNDNTGQSKEQQQKRASASMLLEIPKKPKKQLYTTILEDAPVVARADKAVLLLQDLLQTNSAASQQQQPQHPPTLPSKQQILKAMALLDLRIKKAEHDTTERQAKVDTAKQAEERERAEKLNKERLEQEQAETAHIQERRQERELEHETKMKLLYEEKKKAWQDELHVAEELLAAKMAQAKQDESLGLEAAIQKEVLEASEQINKDIVKGKREYERAILAASKSQTKAEAVQDEYQACKDKADEEVRNENVDKCGPKAAVNPSDLVRSILAENQRKAAEGHLLSQSLAMWPWSNDPSETSPPANDWVDPVYHRSGAEWAQMTANVTGPGNALYTEPNQAPFYKHNEQTFQEIAPFLKERISLKKRKLEAHLCELAEEYDYRKRKYNKHQMLKKRRKNSTNSSRASLTVSRQSILGGKTAAASTNTAAVSSAVSTSNILPGRASNNPYRRPRRGNEVRSEYEQEQVIAELAAKEAMDKRIAFGGCKPTPQIGRLERVRVCYGKSLVQVCVSSH